MKSWLNNLQYKCFKTHAFRTAYMVIKTLGIQKDYVLML